jgi:hypothetical protein
MVVGVVRLHLQHAERLPMISEPHAGREKEVLIRTFPAKPSGEIILFYLGYKFSKQLVINCSRKSRFPCLSFKDSSSGGARSKLFNCSSCLLTCVYSFLNDFFLRKAWFDVLEPWVVMWILGYNKGFLD